MTTTRSASCIHASTSCGHADGHAAREVESGFRYTPTTTFETFPFPRPTDAQREAIASAARRLDELRRGWLDPPGASEEDLKLRTLTNLYNEMPAWLRDIHARLDAAVLDAYGWPADITDDDLLERLLALNLERAEVRRRRRVRTGDERAWLTDADAAELLRVSEAHDHHRAVERGLEGRAAVARRAQLARASHG